VTFIFIKPTHRRSGIGSQLVQLAVEKAKDAGIPLHVTTEPDAHEFFLSQGFKDTKSSDIDLAKWASKNSGFGIFSLFGMIKST
jgi:N-acetylglutamate synthase-like GNAT family acetyltransferase